MKVTCSKCGGEGLLSAEWNDGFGQVRNTSRCLVCNGTGRVESRPRHTSLTLACADGGYDFLRLSEDPGTKTLCVALAASNENAGMARSFIYLDAEAEASLLRWLKAREEESNGLVHPE